MTTGSDRFRELPGSEMYRATCIEYAQNINRKKFPNARNLNNYIYSQLFRTYIELKAINNDLRPLCDLDSSGKTRKLVGQNDLKILNLLDSMDILREQGEIIAGRIDGGMKND